MNKIEQLIEELCPQGVEFKTLGEVGSIYDGTHQTPKYTDEGVKFVSVENIKSLYTTDKYISKEDFNCNYKIKPQINDVFMTRIGSIGACTVVDRDDALAFYVTLALIRPNQTKINSRYIKFILESRTGKVELRKKTLVNAVPIKINLGDIGKIQIPIPPLTIQKEIVKILDNFTRLEAELEAELEARKKQYEHYREELLSFGDDVEWKALGEVCDLKAGKSISANDISNSKDHETSYACIGGNGLRGYVRSFSHDGGFPVIGRQGALCGNIYFANGKFYATEHAVVVSNGDRLISRFLYHLLTVMNLNQYATGGAQPGVAVKKLNKIQIPIPPLAIQEEIVAILDKFDALVNDISTGLPAEISARKKQYEYYRNQLLTFKPLELQDAN